MKVGQKFKSKEGRFVEITAVGRDEIEVLVDRKVADRKTGEISLDRRPRTVQRSAWSTFIRAYAAERSR